MVVTTTRITQLGEMHRALAMDEGPQLRDSLGEELHTIMHRLGSVLYVPFDFLHLARSFKRSPLAFIAVCVVCMWKSLVISKFTPRVCVKGGLARNQTWWRFVTSQDPY